MTPHKHIPDRVRSGLSRRMDRWRSRLPDKGFAVLALVIVSLSVVACLDFAPRTPLVTTGEVAPADIMADRSLLIEDRRATEARRLEHRQMQPLICDLDFQAVEQFRADIQTLLVNVNLAEQPEDREALRQRLSLDIGEEISLTTVAALATPQVQSALRDVVLPYAQKLLSEGVLMQMRQVLEYKGGVLIRNFDTGSETLLRDSHVLADLKSTDAQIVQKIRELPLTNQHKRALGQVVSGLLRPTLIPNYDLTASRTATLERAVEPVLHKIQRGEILVRQGDRVTVEQQLKVVALWEKQHTRFEYTRFLGILICGLLLSSGLLFSPSGKPVSPMGTRDFLFIATLVASFALIAKGFSLLGMQLAASSPTFTPESLAYAVPVAGASALASLIFSTRRYLVSGLLLAFFCTLMSKGGLPLFLFYFLSAMWSTWLTARTQSRQDVVWSMLPLAAGCLIMWAGATFLQGGAHTRYLCEFLTVTGGALFSMFLTFALAPVVEMTFGYTTRFRLMELLNLEQPLLRDLMLNAPGTYHHSLIVSNMVEAGAKAVGAHSLLCKVAALYHDIGKLAKPEYFIENQTPDDNPHDRLTPSMSALILISHAKKGVELGEQHRLGREVTDIIRQHHGTSTIRYFYQKALQQKDALPPKEEDFSYPGPRPQSREAAIVMLADVVEASSRALADPAPAKLRQHIDSTIKAIHADGQLDESELTFKDLDVLADNFHRVLRGIFHHRISYPEKSARPLTEKEVCRQESKIAFASPPQVHVPQ